MIEGFHLSTSIGSDDEAQCGIIMSLSGEELESWLEFLRTRSTLTIRSGRFRVTVETVAEGGEECPA